MGSTNTLAHTSYTECCRLQCRAVHHRHCRYRGGKQLIHTPALCVCHCQASDPPYPVPRLQSVPPRFMLFIVLHLLPWSKQKIGNTLSFGCIWCSLCLSHFVLQHNQLLLLAAMIMIALLDIFCVFMFHAWADSWPLCVLRPSYSCCQGCSVAGQLLVFRADAQLKHCRCLSINCPHNWSPVHCQQQTLHSGY